MAFSRDESRLGIKTSPYDALLLNLPLMATMNHILFPVTDSYRSTHPIVLEIKDPRDTDTAFDEITYGKGSAVIRMMKNYIGDEAFRSGIHEYLNNVCCVLIA